jgi:hypothetical protein
MDLVRAVCAGLDVRKETVVACVRKVVGGQVRQEVRTFRTETGPLLALADWRSSSRCSSTGRRTANWEPTTWTGPPTASG